MADLQFYRRLWQAARGRQRSPADYVAFQRLQAEQVYRDIAARFPVSTDWFVLDFGCGRGGYTEFLAQRFAATLGVDYYVQPAGAARARYRSADLLEFQLDGAADMVFCASVIEHTPEPVRLLLSIYRNLKPGGYLYLSFPPFRSIGGGHQLKPFHYLPERLAIWIGKKAGRIPGSVQGYKDLFGSWGLYRRSIGEVGAMLERSGFRLLAVKPRFLSGSPVNLARIPFLRDFVTWHVEFYCVRPVSADSAGFT